jgi:hypothetical protein
MDEEKLIEFAYPHNVFNMEARPRHVITLLPILPRLLLIMASSVALAAT